MQGRGWLESGWYREIKAPLDFCWILDAMIGEAGQTFALAHLMLTRPRSAHPFTADDVQRLDRRPQPSDERPQVDEDTLGIIGTAGIDTLTTNEPAYVLGWVMQPISYARHRFPPDIIRHAVWLYLRLTLSYRDVEDTPG